LFPSKKKTKSSKDEEFDLAENPLEPNEGDIEDEFISG
jgi:hypothetical protein